MGRDPPPASGGRGTEEGDCAAPAVWTSRRCAATARSGPATGPGCRPSAATPAPAASAGLRRGHPVRATRRGTFRYYGGLVERVPCTTSLLDERQAAFAARRSQKSSKRPLRMQQRRAMMALAPATVQRMPARLSRAPICLHPASTTPDETHRPWRGTADSASGGGSRTRSECTFAPRAWSRRGCAARRRRRTAGRRRVRHAGPWPTGRPGRSRDRRWPWRRRTGAAWRGRCQRSRWRRETARRRCSRSNVARNI